MERVSVQSSNLESVGYDYERQILEIRFHGGGTYDYYDVLPAVFDALRDAGSKGKFFHQFIKNRYSFRKVG